MVGDSKDGDDAAERQPDLVDADVDDDMTLFDLFHSRGAGRDPGAAASSSGARPIDDPNEPGRARGKGKRMGEDGRECRGGGGGEG